MFSPYYASARRRDGEADPHDHVAVNAVLYGAGTGRWAMTERGRSDLRRDPDGIAIGSSRMCWSGGRLEISVDEWTFPLPSRLVGTVTIEPGPIFNAVHGLDGEGRHRWRPVAPLARATVRFERPRLTWEGAAYVDMNAGDEPLEAGFRCWTWSRATGDGTTSIFYDPVPRRGPQRSIALEHRADGTLAGIAAPPTRPLPPTLWRVARSARSDAPPAGTRTLEDTPFYTRTACRLAIEAATRDAVCESVDLDRFAASWVQALLPFRMPRRARRLRS